MLRRDAESGNLTEYLGNKCGTLAALRSTSPTAQDDESCGLVARSAMGEEATAASESMADASPEPDVGDALTAVSHLAQNDTFPTLSQPGLEQPL